MELVRNKCRPTYFSSCVIVDWFCEIRRNLAFILLTIACHMVVRREARGRRAPYVHLHVGGEGASQGVKPDHLNFLLTVSVSLIFKFHLLIWTTCFLDGPGNMCALFPHSNKTPSNVIN